MKNIWSIALAIGALFVGWKLWQAFSASGGFSNLLGSSSAPAAPTQTGTTTTTITPTPVDQYGNPGSGSLSYVNPQPVGPGVTGPYTYYGPIPAKPVGPAPIMLRPRPVGPAYPVALNSGIY